MMEGRFDSDLDELVAGLDGEIASAQELTQLTSERQRRASFKLTFTDGRLYKARLHASTESGSLVARLSPLLRDLPFAQVIAVKGRTTIEEWIEGVPLQTPEVTDEQAYRAGSLLGSLHTLTAIPAGLVADPPDVDWHLRQMETHLAAISGHLADESQLCKSLVELARRHRPDTLEAGLIHVDFSADNIVVTGQGDLVVIDNEHLQVGALEYDLARCWSRWPMSASRRQAFRKGYHQHRSLGQFMANQQFWAIGALSLSLLVHLEHGRANQAALDALHRLARGETDQFWPRLPVLSET